jgi:sigma-E factor negative regulatory protein RseA
VGAAAPAATFVSAAAPEPVWVNTPQGVVMRDPRMEELMHAHRQAGGGPVLQVPAGFLRAATHDAVQR